MDRWYEACLREESLVHFAIKRTAGRNKPICCAEVRFKWGYHDTSEVRFITVPASGYEIREAPIYEGADDTWDEIMPIAALWEPLLAELRDMQIARHWQCHPVPLDDIAMQARWGFTTFLDRSKRVGPFLPANIELPYHLNYKHHHFCRVCGIGFFDVGNRARYHRWHFCSETCHNIAAASNKGNIDYNAERAEKRLEARSNRLCAHCAEPFTPARATGRFCSTRCRIAAHRNANGK